MLRYSSYNADEVREPDLPEWYGSDNSSAADNQQERLIKVGWITVSSMARGVFQSTSFGSLTDSIGEVTKLGSR